MREGSWVVEEWSGPHQVCCVACSSGVGVLTAARPSNHQGRTCRAPNVRAPKRQLSAFHEAVLELVVLPDPYPSCLLPGPEALYCRIDQVRPAAGRRMVPVRTRGYASTSSAVPFHAPPC